jgi:hypothetical protein
MKRLIFRILVITIITIGFLITYSSINHNKQVIQLHQIQIQDTQLKLNVLQNKYNKAVNDKNTTEQQLEQLEKDKQDLQNQLQAKLDKQNKNVAYASPAPARVQSDDYYVNWIIQHESGGNPYAVNSQGCLGLMQACPGSKLTAVCPDLNVPCQMTFFTNYAVNRYGSWYNAWLAWQRQGWW